LRHSVVCVLLCWENLVRLGGYVNQGSYRSGKTGEVGEFDWSGKLMEENQTSVESHEKEMGNNRRRTWTVQSYSPGGANVHPRLVSASLDPRESTCQTTSRSF